jgi:hypothetical protein
LAGIFPCRGESGACALAMPSAVARRFALPTPTPAVARLIRRSGLPVFKGRRPLLEATGKPRDLRLAIPPRSGPVERKRLKPSINGALPVLDLMSISYWPRRPQYPPAHGFALNISASLARSRSRLASSHMRS